MKTIKNIKTVATNMTIDEIIAYYNDNSAISNYAKNEIAKLALNACKTSELNKSLKRKEFSIVNDANTSFTHASDLLSACTHYSLINSDDSKRLLQIDSAKNDTYNIVLKVNANKELLDKIKSIEFNASTLAVYFTDSKYAHKMKYIEHEYIIDIIKLVIDCMYK